MQICGIKWSLEQYYVYIVLYVDDCLCIHHDEDKPLYEIDKYLPLKKGLFIGDPDIFLGLNPNFQS